MQPTQNQMRRRAERLALQPMPYGWRGWLCFYIISPWDVRSSSFPTFASSEWVAHCRPGTSSSPAYNRRPRYGASSSHSIKHSRKWSKLFVTSIDPHRRSSEPQRCCKFYTAIRTRNSPQINSCCGPSHSKFHDTVCFCNVLRFSQMEN